ncbi:MAG: DUF4440 domain-containing protein [Gemmatimonadaceae bacterium]
MKRICTVVLALSVVACSPKAAENGADTASRQMSATNDRATVQLAIDSALVGYRDGLLKGDTAKMSNVYTDDAMVLFPNAPLARGRSGINKLNAGLLAAFTVTAASFKTTDLIVTGDYAIETGTYEMTMRPKTGAPIADVGKYVSIWQKQPDGSWKMVRDISNSDKAAM